MISFCGWWSQMCSSLHPFSPVAVSAHHELGKAAAPRKRHPPCPPLKGGRKKWIDLLEHGLAALLKGGQYHALEGFTVGGLHWPL